MKARKKVLIDVFQARDEDWDRLVSFADRLVQRVPASEKEKYPNMDYLVYDRIHAVWIPFKEHDYVARGLQGEYYPIAYDVFEATYEIV